MGQFAGHYHVAWNSPLAWLQAERITARSGRQAEAIAMRDTDCDLTSVVEVDAACMIDGNHLLFGTEGTLPAGQTRVLAQTAAYDHCNFTVVNELGKQYR